MREKWILLIALALAAAAWAQGSRARSGQSFELYDTAGNVYALPGSTGGVLALRLTLTGTDSYAAIPRDVEPGQGDTTSALVGTSTEGALYRFFLDRRITVDRIVFNVATGSPTDDACFALYDAAGTAKLVETGPVATDTTGVKNIDVSNVTIGPGMFIGALGNENPSNPNQITVHAATTSTNFGAVLNAGVTHLGLDSSAHTACTFDASVSFTSAVDNQPRPFIKFTGGS